MSGERRTRIYKNRWFAKFASREGISDVTLVAAIDRADRGLIDGDLGGGLIKQRVAREGGGKSGGYRTLGIVGIQDSHLVEDVIHALDGTLRTDRRPMGEDGTALSG
jgi:RelE toxin of RelE / RelB toxin-antitoxin system